jgi:hypothetical protein
MQGRDVAILRRDTVTGFDIEPAPPKSTGRELFNIPWVNSKLGVFRGGAQHGLLFNHTVIRRPPNSSP